MQLGNDVHVKGIASSEEAVNAVRFRVPYPRTEGARVVRRISRRNKIHDVWGVVVG
jgi:hypothetical protein